MYRYNTQMNLSIIILFTPITILTTILLYHKTMRVEYIIYTEFIVNLQ